MKKKILIICVAIAVVIAIAIPCGILLFKDKGCSHSWNAGEITTEATCNEVGVKTFTCEDCGETKTEEVPKSEEHNHVGSVTTKATCEEDGLMTYVCSVCGDSYTEVIPHTEHKYTDKKCEYCGDVIASENLVFTLSGDGEYYILTGLGNCTDQVVGIPAEYNNKPVKEMAESVFMNCKSIKTVVLPDTITIIPRFAFRNSSIESIVIPNTVTLIGNSSFMGCVNLSKVTIGTKVDTIDDYAFFECSKIEEIFIPESVMNIDFYVFTDTGLTSITFEVTENWVDKDGKSVDVTGQQIINDLVKFSGGYSLTRPF